MRRLKNLVTVMRQTYQIPAVAVAVTVPGQGCWASATGPENTGSGAPLTLADQFPIGSITKTFTATVILQLVQQGKLSLSAPVSRWVPYVQHASAITVKMLLNMTSGIYDEPGGQLLKDSVAHPGTAWTPQQVVRFAAGQGPAGPPGKFYYSDTNYIILGMIAQAVTGEPIQKLISQRILQPLHLTHTSFPTAAAPPRLPVQGYTVEGKSAFPTSFFESPAELSFSGAAGAMISTVADLHVWARALATGTLLSPSMQRQRLQLAPMPLPAFPPLPGTGVAAGLPPGYGLGLYSLGGWLGHKGAVTGYNADMFYLPAKNATIIVLVNARSPRFLLSTGEDVGDAAAISIAQIAVPGAQATPG
jgi:D-alanyl-D-alanine carboxypeptidase